jgi:hypothetical protein
MKAEGIVDNWYKSPWLKGSLCLILNETGQTALCGSRIHYDRNIGLIHTREEK